MILRNLLIVVLVAASIVFLALAGGVLFSAGDNGRPDAAPAPLFTADTIDGTSVNLADLRGRVVILNIWASWCPPCIAEFPDLLALARRYPDRFVLVAVSVDSQESDIRRFLQRFDEKAGDGSERMLPDNVLIIQDADRAIATGLYNVRRFPESFIIGPAGRIRQKITGVTNWTGPDMTDLIGKLVREMSPAGDAQQRKQQ